MKRSTRGPEGEDRAWGWVAHLRAGGTTPWAEWTGLGQPGGRFLPGAQQLELLRRLNLTGRPSSALAERVLTASAPGRGRPDLELVGATERQAFGPAPVDPGTLPEDELVRVATGLLAEDLVAGGLPDAPRQRRVRLLRRRYRLLGDPLVARPLRAHLLADGRPPGGSGAHVSVVGDDLERLLVHVWTAQVLEGGAPPWHDWLSSLVRRDRLPRRVDLAAIAESWVPKVGADHVHVVLDPAHLPRLVGVRRLPAQPADLAADAVELVRRTAPVLGLLVVPPVRERLLWERMRAWVTDAPGLPLAVPRRHQAWLTERARRMREDLRLGGYAVHGDAATLLPGPGSGDLRGATGPSEPGVLALALRLLHERRDLPADPREGVAR